MEDDMVALFPRGIRTLIVDDDAKFLKSATKLLSFLNFDVVTCSTVTHALKSLMNDGLKGFDVILVHAVKAATYSFDFRAIIEAKLLIPVIYFLPQDHKATGDEADRLLQAGAYVIQKPQDANEVRSLLWKVIAFRKRGLETKASRGGAGGDAGFNNGGEDEDRAHFRVAKGTCRKRKASSSNPGSSFAGTTGAAAGGHLAARGKEKDNVASQQQPAQQKHGQGKKAQKNGSSEAFKLLQPNNGMMNGPQPAVHSVFRTLGVLSFGNNMPVAAAPTMAAAATSATYETQFSQVIGNQQPQDVHPLLMFGPFPYQGPPPPPLAAAGMAGGGAIGGASAAVGTEAVAYGNDVSLAFLQAANLGAEQGGDEELTTAGTVGMGTYAGMADPPMAPPAPQPFRYAFDSATMEWLLSDDFDDYVAGSPPAVAPNNQVPGMTSNVGEPTTMAGGAPFMSPQVAHDVVVTTPNGGITNAAPVMAAHQDLISAVPNGDDQEAQEDDDINGSLMGSQGQGTGGAAMDADDAMLPLEDQYEDNTSSPVEALLGDLHGPIFEFDDVFDLDILLGGLTSGGAAAADDDDASLITGEEDGSMDGLGNLDGLTIPYDLLNDFLFPYHKNYNNVRE